MTLIGVAEDLIDSPLTDSSLERDAGKGFQSRLVNSLAPLEARTRSAMKADSISFRMRR